MQETGTALAAMMPEDLSCSMMSRSSRDLSDSDSEDDREDYCSDCNAFCRREHSCLGPRRPQTPEDNNNIEGYTASHPPQFIPKTEFLANFNLKKSPESARDDEEQDCFIQEYRRMKLKGEFPCRLCPLSFPNLRALKGHNRVHMTFGILQCNLCLYKDSDKAGLLRHMRCHNGDRPYECSLCNFAFTTKANCERHLRNRHSATKLDLGGCIVVREETEKRDATTMTIDDVPLDLSTKRSSSPIRITTTPSIPYIDVKMVVKNGVLVPKQKQRRYRTERPFGCDYCSARFTLRSNMERHVKQQHPQFYSQRKRRPKDDDKIPAVSLNNNNGVGVPTGVGRGAGGGDLKRREEDLHDLASVSRLLDNARGTFRRYLGAGAEENSEEEEGLIASVSNSGDSSDDKFYCSRISTLVIIISEAENKKKSAYSMAPNRVSCPYCHRKFPWSSSLRRHILTHTGQKPFKCPHCSLVFTTKSNCDRHLLRKHGSGDRAKRPRLETDPEHTTEVSGSEMPFKCHLCEGAFTERQDTLDHLMERHRQEYESLVSKGALDSSCEDEEDDTRHRADYINRKVVCAFCLRRFWSAEDLRRHMRTHTGERPFSCSVCSRRFTLKHSMLRHRKKHDTETTPEPESDLIGNLLGIRDRGLVEAMLEKGASDAAKILGVEKAVVT